MNSYNHHRVINEFANRIRHESKIKQSIISDEEIQTLIDASDFTDDFFSTRKRTKSTVEKVVAVTKNIAAFANPILNVIDVDNYTQDDFFFYHFYYDIVCEDGAISLKRSARDDYNYKESLKRCDYDKNIIKTTKQFFTVINCYSETPEGDDRAIYLKDTKFDSSNQSDCVAFLHAMGAEDEIPKKSENVFREHIRRCLSEFLFLKDKKEAFFMLGIALHGIMDSFTPSHTGFKKYALQEMSLHAQGDVIPFIKREYNYCIENNDNKADSSKLSKKFGDIPDDLKKYFVADEGYSEKKDVVSFEPGQYSKDVETDSKVRLAAIIKQYNNDNHLNIIEYEMLKIFIDSYLDKKNDNDIKSLYEGKCDLSYSYWTGGDPQFESCSKLKLNEILKKKEYEDDAFIYAESAINVIQNIYIRFLMERQKCLNNYDEYKKIKGNISSIFTSYWENKYVKIQTHIASKIKLYMLRDIKGMVTVNDVKKHGGIIADTVKGIIKDCADTNARLNSPDYHLYGGANKI